MKERQTEHELTGVVRHVHHLEGCFNRDNFRGRRKTSSAARVKGENTISIRIRVGLYTPTRSKSQVCMKIQICAVGEISVGLERKQARKTLLTIFIVQSPDVKDRYHGYLLLQYISTAVPVPVEYKPEDHVILRGTTPTVILRNKIEMTPTGRSSKTPEGVLHSNGLIRFLSLS